MVFVYTGDFVRDKQEGMGALFMMQRQRKYVAEYVNGAPITGTMLDIDNSDLEPLQGQLIALALHKKLENATSGKRDGEVTAAPQHAGIHSLSINFVVWQPRPMESHKGIVQQHHMQVKPLEMQNQNRPKQSWGFCC